MCYAHDLMSCQHLVGGLNYFVHWVFSLMGSDERACWLGAMSLHGISVLVLKDVDAF